jgi:hypothetical protein
MIEKLPKQHYYILQESLGEVLGPIKFILPTYLVMHIELLIEFNNNRDKVAVLENPFL